MQEEVFAKRSVCRKKCLQEAVEKLGRSEKLKRSEKLGRYEKLKGGKLKRSHQITANRTKFTFHNLFNPAKSRADNQF
jgi:hypothetical protein